jgi:hypothetical protein
MTLSSIEDMKEFGDIKIFDNEFSDELLSN